MILFNCVRFVFSGSVLSDFHHFVSFAFFRSCLEARSLFIPRRPPIFCLDSGYSIDFESYFRLDERRTLFDSDLSIIALVLSVGTSRFRLAKDSMWLVLLVFEFRSDFERDFILN